jgi:hypothetical protein
MAYDIFDACILLSTLAGKSDLTSRDLPVRPYAARAIEYCDARVRHATALKVFQSGVANGTRCKRLRNK